MRPPSQACRENPRYSYLHRWWVGGNKTNIERTRRRTCSLEEWNEIRKKKTYVWPKRHPPRLFDSLGLFVRLLHPRRPGACSILVRHHSAESALVVAITLFWVVIRVAVRQCQWACHCLSVVYLKNLLEKRNEAGKKLTYGSRLGDIKDISCQWAPFLCSWWLDVRIVSICNESYETLVTTFVVVVDHDCDGSRLRAHIVIINQNLQISIVKLRYELRLK